MTYNTGNPVPSKDPRDLDDNAEAFDRFLQSDAPSEPDRLGVQRKTWHQMEADAAALVSPNVSALAAVVAAANMGVFFSGDGPVTMGTYTLTSFARSLGAATDAASFRSLIGAMSLSDTAGYAGSAAKLTTPRTIAATGDGSWSVSFDGSANATAALTLASTGVTAGTYGTVTVNAKGLVTAATAATPIANGGTAATTAVAAGTNLGTATVGTNTDQLARASMIQAEIANKRGWTSYTPIITPSSGAFSNATATGSYMVAFGICHFYATLTITTKGTGTFPSFTLPVAALAGSVNQSMPATERAINGKSGVAQLTSATVARCKDSANADLVTADGCIITIMGFYPVA